MSLSPKLDDLFLRASLLMDPRVQMLEPMGLQILLRLVSAYAATLVWTYSPPSEEGLLDDDLRLARLCGVERGDWDSHRDEVSRFFSVRDGRWCLREGWIQLSPQIGGKPMSDAAVMGRQHVHNGWLSFRAKKKNKVVVDMPVAPELQIAIDAARVSRNGSQHFLINEWDKPFSATG